jgi:hypothetical protein
MDKIRAMAKQDLIDELLADYGPNIAEQLQVEFFEKIVTVTILDELGREVFFNPLEESK